MDNQNSSDQQANQGEGATPNNYYPSKTNRDDRGIRLQINQADIPPRTIKQRHIEAWIVFSGLDANKPTVGTQNVMAYFALDTKKLYLYNSITKTFNYVTLT